MKLRIFSLVFLFLFLTSTSRSFAAEDWAIREFISQISVENDGRIKVTEEINADFDSEKHGIFRDIPVVYTKSDGSKFYSKIDLVSVTDGQGNIPYETSTNGDFLEIKIGDPERKISGEQSYKITYFVSGVLTSFSDYDELYWNVTGNQWEVPIEKAKSVITLPSEAVKQVACFEGERGSTNSCRFEKISEKEVRFFAKSRLDPGEGLTVVLSYEKGLVPILKIEKPKTIFDDLFSPLSFVFFALTALVGLGGVFWIWYRNGRDSWNRRRFIDDPLAVEEVKPLLSHETIVVEYSSPENLRPAEVGALLDERADSVDVTATIVDLATRGFLKIEEIAKSWAFGKTDYKLIKNKEADKSFLSFEKELFDRLFDSGKEVKISSLKEKFYKDLQVVKEKIYEHLVEKKLFIEHPENTRNKYIWIGVGVMVVGGLVVGAGFLFTLVLLVSFGAGIVLASMGLLIISQMMPRKTSLGREMFRRSKGYLLFISTAEKHRQKFFENKNMFNEVLPYAIALGLVGKFAHAFKEMGIEPTNMNWYIGVAAFNAVDFGKSVNSFSSSFSSALASAPGSSGFSGGSSGGGFGGGGGGSW